MLLQQTGRTHKRDNTKKKRPPRTLRLSERQISIGAQSAELSVHIARCTPRHMTHKTRAFCAPARFTVHTNNKKNEHTHTYARPLRQNLSTDFVIILELPSRLHAFCPPQSAGTRDGSSGNNSASISSYSISLANTQANRHTHTHTPIKHAQSLSIRECIA